MTYGFENNRRQRTIFVALIPALILAGCVTVPDIQDAALATPEVALHSRAEVIAAQHTLVEEPVPSEWWKLFRDDTLTRLQNQAVTSNLDLLAAAARME